MASAAVADTSIIIYPYFHVKDWRLAAFKASFPAFYEKINPAMERMLYYGFSVDEENNMVMCREAYEDAAGVLKHFENVDAPYKAALALAELRCLEVHGPPDELEKLMPKFSQLTNKFYAIQPKAVSFGLSTRISAARQDTAVFLLPRFKVELNKLPEFKAGFEAFYAKIDPVAEKMLCYGFTVDDTHGMVMCREAYVDAEGLLKHLENVAVPLKLALCVGTLDSIEVHGPAHQLEKLKGALTPLGCKFYALQPESITFTPGELTSDFLSGIACHFCSGR